MIGYTVASAPASNPAAVRPAAKPRRSANHFNALPTHVRRTSRRPRSEPVYAPSFQRHEPRFGGNENREGDLDVGASPVNPNRGAAEAGLKPGQRPGFKSRMTT